MFTELRSGFEVSSLLEPGAQVVLFCLSVLFKVSKYFLVPPNEWRNGCLGNRTFEDEI